MTHQKIKLLSGVLMFLMVLATTGMQPHHSFIKISPTLTLSPVSDLNQGPYATAEPEGNQVLQGYRIIYVAAENATTPDDIITPKKLQHDMGALIATDWDSVLEADAEAPLQVVIIDRSALAFVDPVWVQAAYRNGVVISLIDIYYPELDDLLGFKCVGTPIGTPAASWYEKDYFITYDFKVVTRSPADRLAVFETLQSCLDSKEFPMHGVSSLSRGRAQDTLTGAYGYRIFNGSLQAALMDNGLNETEASLSVADIIATETSFLEATAEPHPQP